MELKRLDPGDPRPEFSCGDEDLDEFYAKDSVEGGKCLMCVTYALIDDNEVVAFFSLSNDAIRKESFSRSAYERLLKMLPRPKRYRSIPAAKIGRLGTRSDIQSSGMGTKVLDI